MLSLRAFESWFPAVLRVLPRLREVGIRVFQHRVLIPVSELTLQSYVSWRLMVFRFNGTLRRILIRTVLRHDFTSNGGFCI